MNVTTISDLVRFIGNLNQFQNSRHMPSPGFWKPYHFAMLASTSKKLGLDNLNLPKDEQLYAARMGLWEAIGLKSPIAVSKKPNEDRFYEACAIYTDGDVSKSSNALQGIARTNSRNTEESVESLWGVLTELLGNCRSHSGLVGDLCGLTCAQVWKNGNLAQIAVVDTGIGIRASLSDNPCLFESLEKRNACDLATEYSVTGKAGAEYHHSGYGLTLAKDILERNQGNLIISSYGEILQINAGKRNIQSNVASWEGTIIIFEWNIDQPLDSKSVYDSWPKQEDLNDDDFDDIF